MKNRLKIVKRDVGKKIGGEMQKRDQKVINGYEIR